VALGIGLGALVLSESSPLEPLSFHLNTHRINHVLDPHFISWNVNPSELLKGPYGYVNYSIKMNNHKIIENGAIRSIFLIGS